MAASQWILKYRDSSRSDGLDGKNIDEVLYGDQKQEDVNSDRALMAIIQSLDLRMK